jgi:hypothetical protein
MRVLSQMRNAIHCNTTRLNFVLNDVQEFLLVVVP